MSPDYLWVVVCLELPDISYCSISNKLLEAIFLFGILGSQTKDVFSCQQVSITHQCVWKPSWLTSQPFLQFILNCKNHPNPCSSSLPHLVLDTTTPSPPGGGDFIGNEISSLTGLVTAYWPDDTQAAGKRRSGVLSTILAQLYNCHHSHWEGIITIFIWRAAFIQK